MPVFGRKKQAQEPEPEDVPIREEMIRLGQFLKLAGLVEHGGEAKEVIAAGEVSVGGEVETRRGRQLHVGDVVRLGSGADSRAARVVDAASYDDGLPW